MKKKYNANNVWSLELEAPACWDSIEHYKSKKLQINSNQSINQ